MAHPHTSWIRILVIIGGTVLLKDTSVSGMDWWLSFSLRLHPLNLPYYYLVNLRTLYFYFSLEFLTFPVENIDFQVSDCNFKEINLDIQVKSPDSVRSINQDHNLVGQASISSSLTWRQSGGQTNTVLMGRVYKRICCNISSCIYFTMTTMGSTAVNTHENSRLLRNDLDSCKHKN